MPEPEEAQALPEDIPLDVVYEDDDVIVTGDRVAHGKPAPDIYLRAAELLQLAPAECAGVEDSLNGVKAVRAAGMRSVMIPDLLPYGPDFAPYVDVRLNSLHELLGALEEKE